MKVPSPVTDNAAGVLREGFADWNRVRTQAILHYDGCAHLLFVDCDEPAVVRRLVSDDGLDWRDAGCLALDTGEVCALHLHQYGVEAILGVTTTSGSVHLLTSTDMANWQPQARLDGVATATPWFVYAQYPSKVAGGQAVYFVPGDDSSRVLCRWGDRWQDAGHWETESLALRAPDGGCTITDVTIAAHFADADGRPAPVIEVSGRTYPVEVRYRPLQREGPPTKQGEATFVEVDQVTGICEAVEAIEISLRSLLPCKSVPALKCCAVPHGHLSTVNSVIRNVYLRGRLVAAVCESDLFEKRDR